MPRPGPTDRRRFRPALGGLLLLALGLPGTTACCLLVTPPRAQDWLEVGFRTPEQTFKSFQVGWRADEPDLEHRCFSRDFRARNQVSRLTYREFRGRLLAEQPLLRLGIADARPRGPAEVRGARARLVLETHGRVLEVDFVLDDYVEVWSGSERILDAYLPFEQHTQIGHLAGGEARLWGHVDLPAEVDATRLSELRLGREWKIDDLRLLDRP